MSKFSNTMTPINAKKVGRVKSVEKEVRLLTFEWWDEKTDIRNSMWRLSTRTFVSIYIGRICIGAVMMRILNKRTKLRWEICNAVVDEDVRGGGLGKLLAELAIRMAWNDGAKEIYLGAELEESRDEYGKKVFETVQQSGAARFWGRMGFKRIPLKDYNRVIKMALEEKSCCAMKMTKRSRAGRQVRSAGQVIKELIARLENVGEEYDETSRAPLIRLCTPSLGDVKITKKEDGVKFVTH